MTDEEVMVVPRPDLEPHIGQSTFDLIRQGAEDILQLIETRHTFIPRPRAEVSPEFKQIIPYVMIRLREEYFVLKRTTKQTESRLHHKLSLGIGGHINPDTPAVLGGLQKELEEEVALQTPYELQFIGILNDDTTDVGRVHLGVVFLLEAAERKVSVRETQKMTGEWVPRPRLHTMRDSMESWSQILYDRFVSLSSS